MSGALRTPRRLQRARLIRSLSLSLCVALLPGCLLEASDCGRGFQKVEAQGCVPHVADFGPRDAEVDLLVIETAPQGG